MATEGLGNIGGRLKGRACEKGLSVAFKAGSSFLWGVKLKCVKSADCST